MRFRTGAYSIRRTNGQHQRARRADTSGPGSPVVRDPFLQHVHDRLIPRPAARRDPAAIVEDHVIAGVACGHAPDPTAALSHATSAQSSGAVAARHRRRPPPQRTQAEGLAQRQRARTRRSRRSRPTFPPATAAGGASARVRRRERARGPYGSAPGGTVQGRQRATRAVFPPPRPRASCAGHDSRHPAATRGPAGRLARAPQRATGRAMNLTPGRPFRPDSCGRRGPIPVPGPEKGNRRQDCRYAHENPFRSLA